MRRKERLFLLTSGVLMLALTGLTACGGTAYKQRASTISSGTNPTGTGTFPGFPTDFPDDTTQNPIPDDGDLEPYGFSFDVTGNTGPDSMFITSEEILTDTILRVRIESGSAGPLDYPGYDAYSMSYGCAQYRVAILQKKENGEFFEGQSRTSQPLSVDGADSYGICKDRNGRTAATSQVLDFSSSTGSFGGVKIKVSNVKYDWKCRFWYDFASDWGEYAANITIGNYGTVCPMVPVYRTHTASGSIRIQTNGTRAP